MTSLLQLKLETVPNGQMNPFRPTAFLQKNSRLKDLKAGPKFIVMARNDLDEKKTMNFVSPFTIQKSIKLHAGGPKSVKRLRNGTLLIETVNMKQADKLCELKLLGSDIRVNVFEHPTLNHSKGTIFCPDLIYETDDVILNELKAQHVVEVIRIKRKKNNDLIDTGVFILTFNLPVLPEKLYAGFIACDVNIYIPNPRRCFNCQEFGHGAKFCNKPEICPTCADFQHDPKPDNCRLAVKCKNCGGNHTSWDRKCPVFIREKDIQRIQTVNKISNYQARQRYAENTPTTIPNQRASFTDTLSQSNVAPPGFSNSSSNAYKPPSPIISITPIVPIKTNLETIPQISSHDNAVPKYLHLDNFNTNKSDKQVNFNKSSIEQLQSIPIESQSVSLLTNLQKSNTNTNSTDNTSITNNTNNKLTLNTIHSNSSNLLSTATDYNTDQTTQDTESNT